MNFFNILAYPFRKIAQFFSSKKVQQALENIANLVPEVESIVKDLRAIDPRTCTYQQIVDLYDKHKVIVADTINRTPAGYGNALLNLATILVKRQNPSLATSSVQAAIQIALVALKAE